MTRRTVYVALLDEGTDVWRPVEAEELHSGLFRILSENSRPYDERWEFPTGSVVRCERRDLSEGPVLVVVSQATV